MFCTYFALAQIDRCVLTVSTLTRSLLPPCGLVDVLHTALVPCGNADSDQTRAGGAVLV